MKLLNPEILKAPQNWVFVAIVIVFVTLVTFHFTKALAPAKED